MSGEIKIDIPGGPAAPLGTPIGESGADEARSFGAPRKAVAPSKLLARLGRSAALSPEATEYVKRLGTAMCENLTSATGQRVDAIEILPVQSEHACIYRISYKKTHHILMGFSDTYTAPIESVYRPLAIYIDRAAEEMAKAGMPVITTEIVTPGSYPLVLRMAEVLTNKFLVLDNPAENALTLADLMLETYYVVTDIAKIRKLVAERLPSNVLPPTDIGMAVYAVPPEQGAERRLMLLISGTTIFVPNALSGTSLAPGDAPEYTRITILTNIYSPSPSIPLTVFGIALATDYFMCRHGWRDQFMDFSPKAPNIGNLIPDPGNEGLPYRVADKFQLRDFITAKIHNQGYLAVDIVDGAPRTPGIELLTINKINRSIAEFLGVDEAVLPPNVVIGTRYAFTGIYDDETDTRCASFLNLVVDDPKNADQYQALLTWTNDQTHALRILDELYGLKNAIQPLYATTTALIGNEFMYELSSIVARSITVHDDRGSGYENSAPLPPIESAAFGNAAMFGNRYSGGGTAGPAIYGNYR